MNYDYKARDLVEKHIIACGLSYVNEELIINSFKTDLKEEYFHNPFTREVAKILIIMYKEGKVPTLEYVTANRSDMYRESFIEGTSERETYEAFFVDLVSIAQLASTKARFETDLFMLKEFVLIDYWNNQANNIINSHWNNRDVLIVSDNIINGYNNLMKEITYSYSAEDEVQTIDDIKQIALKKINERNAGIDTTIKLGHTYLDNHVGGFGGSEFIIIGGRPGMGKTAFGLAMAKKLSIEGGRKGAYFTLEMSKEQLLNKYASNALNIEYSKLKSYNIDQATMNRLFGYYEYIESRNLDILFTSNLDKISNTIKTGGYDYVIVDYLQLITTTESFQSREQQVSHISRTLKNLSRQLNIPLIALCQLKRVTGRPNLTDLRESGSLEQDADTVIFPYRPAYDNKDAQAWEHGNVELLLEKCRSSGTGLFNGYMDLTAYEILDFPIINYEQWQDFLNSKKY
jgi:replicative DNA helicase